MPGTKAVVIGGGVIGTSVGYFLAREGIEVTLVERFGLASGASGACEGLLLVQSKKPGVHLRMALQSIRSYRQLALEIGGDVGFEQCGALFVATSTEELEYLKKRAAELEANGAEPILLGPEQAHEAEPLLGCSVLGACLTLEDAKLNPLKLVRALATGIRRMGGVIYSQTETLGIEVSGGRVVGVCTTRGRLVADLVVNAAGAWAATVGQMVGLALPIEPRRGQVLVTESLPPMIARPVVDAGYSWLKFAGVGSRDQSGVWAPEIRTVLEQTADGNLLIGSTREFAGFDRSVTYEGICHISRAACTLVPSLARASVIRAFAGLRPHTPDGLPIICPAGPDGFFVAAGHEGDGITLAPFTGEMIADMVLDRQTDVPAEFVDALRFGDDRGAGNKQQPGR